MFSTNLGPPFVDYEGHYSNGCFIIRRPPKSSLSCNNQDSIVQRSSLHKCSWGVWWGALNMVVATIPPITSGLTPSLKLFLYSVAPSGNVPLMWPWLASLALLSECMVSSELHYPLWYDTWHYYLIKFLYLTIAPKNSSFSLLYEEKNGVSILGDWLHTHLCFSHVRTLLRMPCNCS